MALNFSWDKTKAASNLEKHGVSFAEAATVFRDALSVTIIDETHSEEEERFVTLGVSHQGNTVVVIHTHRAGTIRIISAREATRKEKQQYES